MKLLEVALINTTVVHALLGHASAFSVSDDALAVLIQENDVALFDPINVELPRRIKRSGAAFA
ncbi:hypothetical protein D3C72_2508740 [compost metagenome]